MRDLPRFVGTLVLHGFKTTRPLNWALNLLNAAFAVILWYFVAQFLGAQHRLHDSSSFDYFTFTLIGFALAQYMWRGFSAVSRRMKFFLAEGSFEAFWVLPCPFALLVILGSIWDFVMATVDAAVLLGFGTLIFGAQISWGCAASFLGIGFLTSLAMGALGLLIASLSFALGAGNLLQPLFNKAVPLLSGTFFSISLFPERIQWISNALPLTHALTLARGIASSGKGTEELNLWILLAGMAAGYLIAGWWAFELLIRKTRATGRLGGG